MIESTAITTTKTAMGREFRAVPDEGIYPANDTESLQVRGERGWAPRDTWNMDTYVSMVLKDMLRFLKADPKGYPSELTPEKWDEILEEMAAGFEAWENHFETDTLADEKSAYDAVQHSLDLMKQWFGHLWS